MTENTRCPCCTAPAPFAGPYARGDGKEIVVCRKCGCGFHRNVLTNADLEQFYQDTYFLEEHPGYTRDIVAQSEDPNSFQNVVLDRIERFQRLAGVEFLDVGAAAGVLLLAARRRGAVVHGIEPSRFASGHAVSEFGLAVDCCTIENAALPREHYDMVTLIDVIEHVLDPNDVIARLRACMKTGGKLCLVTPNFRLFRLLGRRWHGFNASYEHVLYFDKESLRTLVARHGFHVTYVETFGMVDLVEYYLGPVARFMRGGPHSFPNRALAKLLRMTYGDHRLLLLATADDSKA